MAKEDYPMIRSIVFIFFLSIAPIFASSSYELFIWKSSFPFDNGSDKYSITEQEGYLNLTSLGVRETSQPVFNYNVIKSSINYSVVSITPQDDSEKSLMAKLINYGLILIIGKTNVINRFDTSIGQNLTDVTYENFDKPKEMQQYTVEESTPR